MNNAAAVSNGLCLLAALACIQRASPAFAYDLHTKALVPIAERAKPAGAPMEFVKGGRLNFVVVADVKRQADAVGLIATAFEKTTGTRPEVVAPGKAEAAASGGRFLLLVGDQPLARAEGVVWNELPSQGFAVKTFPRGIMVVGNDTFLDPAYNKGRLDHLGPGRGTYYGAIDFCERFLGVRYYFLSELGKIYPKTADLTIEPVHYVDAPYFTTRGAPYNFVNQVNTPKKLKAWERFFGPVKKGDISLYHLWRCGGTRPPHGKHYPDPQRLMKRLTEEEKDRVFFRDAKGRRWINPGNHYGNYFDPIRLDGFADFFCDAVRNYYACDGRENPYGFSSLVNNTYVNFGVCDTLAKLRDYETIPLVQELGLVTDEDKDPSKTEERGQMRNIYGRFYQYMGNRLKRECPGKRLFCLVYYNSLWAPTDPRWKLPDNIDVIVCDGQILSWALCPEVQERSRRLFGGWKKALQDRPCSMAYVYTPGQTAAPIAIQHMGDVPKILGDALGRDGIYFDSGVNYRIFYAFYAAAHQQWNPDFDAVAATEEAFDLCCGKEAGRHLKKFYHDYKKVVETRFMAMKNNSSRLTADEVRYFEGLLAQAKAAVPKGGDEEKRFNLIYDYWPRLFERERVIAAYRRPEYTLHKVADSEVALDGKGDEPFWRSATPMAFMHIKSGAAPRVPTSLRLAWSEKGVYGFFETAEAPFQTPEKDLWSNDSAEVFLSQGLGEAEWHQFAFDSLGRHKANRKRERPIPQPIDDMFKPTTWKSACLAGEKSWSAEFFVPFDVLWNPEPPKTGEKWLFNFVKTSMADGEYIEGTSLTLGRNSNMRMFDVVTFAE
ncbi:MAG: hypothetical protein IJG13_15560 [Kiritimatiellae bacterium]|nr:hypothetical protein [Kiritimatiellia bacterium]